MSRGGARKAASAGPRTENERTPRRLAVGAFAQQNAEITRLLQVAAAEPPAERCRLFGRGHLEFDRRGGHEALDGSESELLLALALGIFLSVDHDDLACRELLVQDLLGQRVFDVALDRTSQRAATELRVVTEFGEQFLGGLLDLNAQTLALELSGEAHQLQVDHLEHFIPRELVEDNGLVDAVEELGPEVVLQAVVDLFLHALVAHGGVVGR